MLFRSAAIEERFGRLDVLINNAGINAEGPLESFDPELWDRLFAVNVRGVLNTCQAVIPLMKRQRAGRIINAASFAAVIPSVDAAAYGASKAAVVQMTRVLASELGPWGVTVNAYAPGMIPTAMNGFAALGEEAAAAKLDQLSVRRWGVPEDVARRLVVRGFFNSIVARIGDPEISDRIMAAIDEELAATPDAEGAQA